MHSVPLALPLQLPERPLEIDPYLLGLWLGDGNSREPAITCHIDDEPHYRMRADAAGERWRIRSSSKNVRTCALSRGRIPLSRTRLNALNLLRNKHVPQKYLRSAGPQRLALLQGLMDSDGTIDHRNGVAEYHLNIGAAGKGRLGTPAHSGTEGNPDQGWWTVPHSMAG